MPQNTAAQSASEQQTQWNTFLANWQRTQLQSNARTLGQSLAPAVADYRRNAQRAMGAVVTGLGKSGNLQFNQRVALGDTSGLSTPGFIEGILETDALGQGLSGVDNMLDQVGTRITDLETSLASVQQLIDLGGEDYTTLVDSLRGQGVDVDNLDRAGIRAALVGLRDNALAAESVAGLDDQIASIQQRLDEGNYGAQNDPERGVVYEGAYTSRERLEEDLARLTAQREAATAAASAPNNSASYEALLSSFDEYAARMDAAIEENSGSVQTIENELTSLRSVQEQLQRADVDINSLLNDILGTVGADGTRSGGVVNNDPIAANQALALTSGSTFANASGMLTQLESGRRRMVNSAIAEMANLVGQAAMADSAAAFNAEMGDYQLQSINYEQQMQTLGNIFTGVRFAISLFGGV